MFLSSFPWHNVPWLYDCVSPSHIDDKDDLWVKTWGTQLTMNHRGGTFLDRRKGGRDFPLIQETREILSSPPASVALSTPAKVLQCIDSISSVIIYVTAYLISTGFAGKFSGLLIII